MTPPAIKWTLIAYGESDFPQCRLVFENGDLLREILSLIYTNPDEADSDYVDSIRRQLDDPDEWFCASGGNKLEIRFEIGGIDVWRLA
ncbi:hypothetical protein BcepF1.043 [Burkholderia phage BcepF1]|uniref:Uncharacterized protein n=1 Tax=Burkholderia phage BcepF1 TaxID=2886897 RepID=A1YZU7_9CAUD|nr:hypothetical protein BcepF1.043 [Burkholderia phage BcepF1]ABL96774.1 hypothetical protein BcepF1.043 [Burkholderia phage BcepF1]